MATLNDNNSASKDNVTRQEVEEEDKMPLVKEVSEHLHRLNLEFCDTLWRQLKQGFASGLSRLPRLERPQELFNRLHKFYMRNIDQMEGYFGRNIFTLDNLPPNRRARIAEIFHTVNTSPEGASTISLELEEPDFLKVTDEESEDVWGAMKKQDKITQEQVQQQFKAIAALRKEIVRARQQKSVLERRSQEIGLVGKMTANFKDFSAEDVEKRVSDLMNGVQELKQCRQQGESALQQAKKRRMENAENETDFDFTGFPSSLKPKTPAEFLQHERKRLKASTEDLKRLNHFLVANSKSGNVYENA